ncbi:SixA phosphatase family protein [Streptomyces roseus]|uniref:Phosphohistidine phosphatase n=1 Tax=Streptomyces roseus TaxID=66430 RepID=A0A0J6XLT7_9ACTN|nr:histidine phosphatase family protein [Streptomyces roseus]KMO95222.1 phosphohistidine phosphatase [Streptomyces roseus]
MRHGDGSPESQDVRSAGPHDTGRRLVILRHAKSAYPDGVPDHDRPLGPRGVRDAPAVGRLFARSLGVPDLVLCSPARRARDTWDLAAAELDRTPPVRHDPRLYAADACDLLDVIREVPPEVGTLLLVGHNPGLEDLLLVVAAAAVGDALERARTKFPTSAVAVLALRGPWSDLGPDAALLTDLAVPRGQAV